MERHAHRRRATREGGAPFPDAAGSYALPAATGFRTFRADVDPIES
jgi:hypothetical protein